MTTPEPIVSVAPELTGRVVASQRWSTVTFVHWRIDSVAIADLLPTGVRPDEHDGSSWVGLIAFQLDRATILGGPVVPYFGSFTELNIRLYAVDEAGRRGVVFLSLEASRLAAVIAARVVFSIPYFWSSTSLNENADGTVEYLARRHGGLGSMRIVARPLGGQPVADATADFLTARWALFTTRFGKTRYLPNTHVPWTLQRAELVDLHDSFLEQAGIAGISDRPPDSVLFSPGVTTRFGSPQ